MSKKLMNSVEQEYTFQKSQMGKKIGCSEWITVAQERINKFAEITEDPQFIHIDPERAKQLSPFGKTIAHGFLVLSLASKFAIEVLPKTSSRIVRINYGFNKVRFIHPVFVDSLVRGTFTLNGVEKKDSFSLLKNFELKIEIKDTEKPALVAEWLILTQFSE
ncbi:MAG: nodulation protein NodN [Rhodobacteraceae bacterium]|nr:MAG: nodulation protein NodN [Paracoccaceae bacterium]